MGRFFNDMPAAESAGERYADDFLQSLAGVAYAEDGLEGLTPDLNEQGFMDAFLRVVSAATVVGPRALELARARASHEVLPPGPARDERHAANRQVRAEQYAVEEGAAGVLEALREWSIDQELEPPRDQVAIQLAFEEFSGFFGDQDLVAASGLGRVLTDFVQPTEEARSLATAA